jgi:hypothetical protein
MNLQIAIVVLGTFAVASWLVDRQVTRARIDRYCASAGLQVVRLKHRFPLLGGGPFDGTRGRHIYCAHLRDESGQDIPAWVAVAGVFSWYSDELLDIKFSRTRAFKDSPNL